MTPAEAARLLDLPPDATAEQLETRFLDLRRKLEDKIAKAPTPGLQAKYRASLADITTAFEQLTLAADGSDLPLLQRSTPDTATPKAAETTGPAPAPAKPSAPATKAGQNREFLLVAVIAVMVTIAGGWFVLKTRGEGQMRAHSAELKTRWDNLGKELAAADRKLTELKAEARDPKNLTDPEITELKARLGAQKAFVDWLQGYLDSSPLVLGLPKIDPLLASQPAAAKPIVAELTTSITAAEQAVATQKQSLLVLGRPLAITSMPAGLTYHLTDAYGRNREGRTPATVQVPWGNAEITITRPGLGWANYEETLHITRDAEVVASAAFADAPVRITSEPAGLRYVLTNSAGLSRTGTTPADLKDVPTGTATLRVSRPDWRDIVKTPFITIEGPNVLTAEFVPATLTVTSDPPGAEIWRGDRNLGVTPKTFIDLAPGDYRFELRLAWHDPANVEARLDMRENGTAHARLQANPLAGLGNSYVLPSLGLELLRVPPGSFERGKVYRINNKVTINRPYFMGKFEITQAQWTMLMGDNPSHHKGANLPVENVSWDDAMRFCRKLTERERAAGRLSNSYEFTLPTAVQFEHAACRDGTIKRATFDWNDSKGTYVDGEDLDPNYGINSKSDVDENCWHEDNSGGETHPVGTKRANARGFHDLHGNVSEWCLDEMNNSSSVHPFCGGHYDTPYKRLFRDMGSIGYEAGIRTSSNGFRIALSSVEK